MRHIFFLLYFFCISTIASNELKINNMPIELIFNDGSSAKISSCTDLQNQMSLGKKIESIPNISDPDYNDIKNKIFICRMQNYISNHRMTKIKDSLSIHDVLNNFPATAAYFISQEEMDKVSREYSNKTILEYTPDLIIDKNKAISQKKYTSYSLPEYYHFKNSDGDEIKIVILAGHSIGGTASSRSYWRIDDDHSHPWTVTELDENSF